MTPIRLVCVLNDVQGRRNLICSVAMADVKCLLYSIMTYIPLSVFAGRPDFVIIYSFLVHRGLRISKRLQGLSILHNEFIVCVCMFTRSVASVASHIEVT